MKTSKVCEICGNPLPPDASAKAKYCSEECRKEGRRLKAKARRRKKKGLAPQPSAELEIPKEKLDEKYETEGESKVKFTCGRCGCNYPDDPSLIIDVKSVGVSKDPVEVKLCSACTDSFAKWTELGKVAGQLARGDISYHK